MADPITPLAWPTDLGYGWIEGRVIVDVGDGADTGDEPDLIPLAGARATIRANTALRVYLGSAGKMLTLRSPIDAVIDAEGYLCRVADGGVPGTRRIPVQAPAADVAPEGAAYIVTFTDTRGATTIPPITVPVRAGQTSDLADYVTASTVAGSVMVSASEQIRLAVETAVAGMPTGTQIDTTGLATTSELETLEASIPAVVLREAPLVDGELIQSTRIEAIEQVDGSTALVLIQTTSTGREVTATIPTISAAAPAASTDVLQAFTWQDLDGLSGLPSQGGWIERRGGLVTLHIRAPQTVGITEARQITGKIAGATVDIPPFGDSRDPVSVQMIRADGTSHHERSRVTEWDGTYYLQPATGEDPTLDALILTWWTNDRGPISLGAAA